MPAPNLSRLAALALALALPGQSGVAQTTAGGGTTGAPEASQATGTITGRIFDVRSGFGLLGAEVSVLETPLSASTGLDGSFRLTGVPAGRVTVRVSKEGYQVLQVFDFNVGPSEPAFFEGSLQPDDGDVVTLEAVRVVAADDFNRSREGFVAQRRQSVTLQDSLSAQDLAKFVATDVMEAAIRIPGFSPSTRGSFAVIRGLSERYNVTTLNGVQIPSSDPSRQNVELDQFPSRVLDGIVVHKTFAPALPGTLSGGGLDLQTATFPAQRTTSLTLGVSVDEGALRGDDFLSYRTRGDADLWARGRDDRWTIPEIAAALEAAGSLLLPLDPGTPFTARRGSVPVGGKFGLHHGNQVEFSSNRRLGYTLTLSYDSSYSSEEGRVNEGADFDVTSTTAEDGTSTATINRRAYPRPGYRYLESTEKVLMGLLASATYQFNSYHQVGLTAFYSRTGLDEAEFQDEVISYTLPATKESLIPGAPYQSNDLSETVDRFRYELLYRDRDLSSLTINGGHTFPALADGRLQWSYSINQASQSEPDYRRFNYFRYYNERQFETRSAEGLDATIIRTWRDIDEEQDVFTLSYQQPFSLFGLTGPSLELGGLRNATERGYNERLGGAAPLAIYEDASEVSRFALTSLLPAGTVDLEREITAGYVGLSLPLLSDRVKLSGGLRAEKTEITSSGFGSIPGSSEETSSVLHYTSSSQSKLLFPLPGGFPEGLPATGPETEALYQTAIDQTDYLPAASIAYTPLRDLEFTIRAAFSRTIARPSIREVSNYYSLSEEDEGVYDHGNALLQLSDVTNYDLRFEYFFLGTDLVALSFFYKEIERPIEKVAAPFPIGGGEAASWINNPGTAEVRGVEFEFRKGLGFLSSSLDGLSVGGNYTYIDAQVPTIFFDGGSDASYYEKAWAYPSSTRRLYDQPRWLANADVTYAVERWGCSATLSVFGTDRVLTTVRRDLDRYRDRAWRLDATYTQALPWQLKLKLSAKNLLDPERRDVRDPTFTGDTPIVDRRWHDGRSYSLTLTKDF